MIFEHSPKPVAPITGRQQETLISLIRRIGKIRNWEYKSMFNIPITTTIPRLTKRQAWLLIGRIISDLDAERGRS